MTEGALAGAKPLAAPDQLENGPPGCGGLRIVDDVGRIAADQRA